MVQITLISVPGLRTDTMSHLHQVPAGDPEAAARDRTRNALVPTVAVVAVLAAALLAVSFPVGVGVAAAGLGSTALAIATVR
jgi:hypothetical protein